MDSEGKLKTIALQGERPRTLATVIDAAGAAWHGDDILIGRGTDSIARISTNGGAPVKATLLRPGAGRQRWPQFLPDGRHFIYTESLGSVMLASLDSTSSTELIDARATAVFDPEGFLLFVRSGRLMAQPVDRASFKPIGSPHAVLDPARCAAGSGYSAVSVAKTGLLAYWDGTTVQTDLAWFDRSGNALTAMHVPREPQGRRSRRWDVRDISR